MQGNLWDHDCTSIFWDLNSNSVSNHSHTDWDFLFDFPTQPTQFSPQNQDPISHPFTSNIPQNQAAISSPNIPQNQDPTILISSPNISQNQDPIPFSSNLHLSPQKIS